MLERPSQPLNLNRGRTSSRRGTGLGPQRGQDAEGHRPPSAERGGPGYDQQDDDPGKGEAQGHSEKRQEVEEDIDRDLDRVDQVEPLGRFENAAEGRADEHDRQRPADEAERQDGLGFKAVGDVEDVPDDERRRQVRQGGGGDPDRRLKRDRRPEVARGAFAARSGPGSRRYSGSSSVPGRDRTARNSRKRPRQGPGCRSAGSPEPGRPWGW